MEQTTKITAHSGAEHTADNSLDFVRYALGLAVDALEVDVRRRADGVLALGHDAADEKSPTLQEVFALVAAHPSMCINCDLKMPGLEREVAALAQQAGLAGRLIFSGTVDAAACAADPALHEQAEIYLNIEEHVPDLYVNYRNIPDFELQAAAEIVAVCKRYDVRTVNINQVLVTRRLVRTLAQEGLELSAWTVNEDSELRWFLENSMRNITTREPSLALALRDRQAQA